MTLQILTIVLGVVAASTLLAKPSVWRWADLAVSLALLTLCGVLLGLYWPMFPACLAVLVCGVVLPFRPPRHTRRSTRIVVLLAWSLCALSALLVYALPFFRMPRPTGRYSVGTRTEHWTDPATQRELVVQLWYPARPTGRRARYMRLDETKPQFVYWHWIRTNSWQDAPAVSTVPGQLARPFPLLPVSATVWGGRRTQDTFLAEEACEPRLCGRRGRSPRQQRAHRARRRGDPQERPGQGAFACGAKHRTPPSARCGRASSRSGPPIMNTCSAC